MPSFKGNIAITLQPEDEKILPKFKFPVKTSVDQTENYLPYGTTISNAVATFTNDDGDDATDDLLYDSVIVTDYYVIVPLKYPTSGGDGYYNMKLVLTLDDGSTREVDYGRIRAKDR